MPLASWIDGKGDKDVSEVNRFCIISDHEQVGVTQELANNEISYNKIAASLHVELPCYHSNL
jgi:hypothetical protein